MSLIPTEQWYHDDLAIVREYFGDMPDRVGRLWYQHFERVALRILFRYPQAGRDLIEAALFHDSLMAGGRGKDGLRALGLSERAIEIVDRTTPPPDHNYFRDSERSTPEENQTYFNYIQRIIDSGDIDSIHFKLADIRDTLDLLQLSSDPNLKAQMHDRYLPSAKMLADAVETPPHG